MNTATVFEETQRPHAAYTAFGLVAVGAAVAWALWSSAVLDRLLWDLLVIFALALAIVVSFRLKTVVTHEHVVVTIVPFPRRRIAVADVERCDLVSFRPLRDYGGWGWKWTPWAGTAYTMRGNRGVRIHPKGKRAFVVGSQRPDELAAAIRSVTPGLRTEA